jgi:hypothetical protein
MGPEGGLFRDDVARGCHPEDFENAGVIFGAGMT